MKVREKDCKLNLQTFQAPLKSQPIHERCAESKGLKHYKDAENVGPEFVACVVSKEDKLPN